jgi:hypothetical protein
MPAERLLDRILDPVADAFTPELARKLVGLRADAELEAHINALREKANEGTLTAQEDAEYKAVVEMIDMVSIIQAKARRYLAQHAAWWLA